MFRLGVTPREKDVLIAILTNKVKELHAWIASTNSNVRDTEHTEVKLLLKKVTLMQRNK